jgi:hypothetical protein
MIKEIVYNLETNEITEIPATEKEIAELEAAEAQAEADRLAAEAEAAAKAEAKQALLDRLSITADEAALLGL